MGINEFLKTILEWIYGFVGNYGWAVVLFTLLVRLIVMPFDYKSRVGMRKMQKIAPMQAKLQKKYEKDPDKMNKSCRSSTVSSASIPFLLPADADQPPDPLRDVHRHENGRQRASGTAGVRHHRFGQSGAGFVAVGQNVWMPDSPFAAAWPNLDSLRQIATNEWLAVFNKLPQETLALLADKGLALTAESFTGDALNTTIQTIYTTMEQLPAYMEHVKYYSDLAIPLFNIHIFVNYNGYFILPILAAGGQFLMTSSLARRRPRRG